MEFKFVTLPRKLLKTFLKDVEIVDHFWTISDTIAHSDPVCRFFAGCGNILHTTLAPSLEF